MFSRSQTFGLNGLTTADPNFSFTSSNEGILINLKYKPETADSVVIKIVAEQTEDVKHFNSGRVNKVLGRNNLTNLSGSLSSIGSDQDHLLSPETPPPSSTRLPNDDPGVNSGDTVMGHEYMEYDDSEEKIINSCGKSRRVDNDDMQNVSGGIVEGIINEGFSSEVQGESEFNYGTRDSLESYNSENKRQRPSRRNEEQPDQVENYFNMSLEDGNWSPGIQFHQGSKIPMINASGPIKPCDHYRRKMVCNMGGVGVGDMGFWLNYSTLQQNAAQKVVSKITAQQKMFEAEAEEQKRKFLNNSFYNKNEVVRKKPCKLEPLNLRM